MENYSSNYKPQNLLGPIPRLLHPKLLMEILPQNVSLYHANFCFVPKSFY